MKKPVLLAYIALVSLFALSGANSANAMSQYDSTINVVPSLRAGSPSNGYIDLTTSYNQIHTCSQEVRDDWALALEQGTWAVVQHFQTGNNVEHIFLIWNSRTNEPPAEFYPIGGSFNYLSMMSTGVMEVYKNTPSDDLYVTCGVGYGERWVAATNSEALPIYQPFVMTHPINYPSGYQGAIPPETHVVPPENVNYWINFTYMNTTTKVVAKYKDYVTDPGAAHGDPELIHWDIMTSGETPEEDESVCSGTTTDINESFDSSISCPDFKPENGKEYYIQSLPFISGHTQDIVFYETQYMIDFSKSGIGDTSSCEPGAVAPGGMIMCSGDFVPNVLECFKVEFPFVDIPGCNENFGMIFKYLGNGGVALPGWSYTPQCTSLNTFDNWLGLEEGYVVCPQFPSAVRDIVTPFIAFFLGIVTLGFINKHNNSIGGNK